MAEDLARRSGLSLNEWLTRLMAEQGLEDGASQPYFPPRPVGSFRQEAPDRPGDEVGRVAQAIERLADRIQTAESRQALAIAGVERSVREVISRIDAAEREQMQTAARFEGLVQEVQVEQGQLGERVRRVETEAQGPRSAEALRALQGGIGEIAGHVHAAERRSREAFAQIGARIEQLDQSEQLSASAMRELQNSCSALDGRLAAIERGAPDGIERAATNLSARVQATRDELTERLAATADARFDRVDQALAQMNEHVRAAEQRSAGALERMGREVLEVAQTLNRRVQNVEHRSAEAAERVGADAARIAGSVDERLARADSIQAQALEKLGAEIARITERLADRIASAERRSAQAIDEVGEQVARVTERISQRHERTASELGERIRLSEERTARLLEEARRKIDAQLAGNQVRPAEAATRASSVDEDVDDALFADAPSPAHDAMTRREPPAFEEADFAAVAEFAGPPAVDPLAPEASAPAGPAPLAAAAFGIGIEPVELEPNVGFDMDDEPVPATDHSEPVATLEPAAAIADAPEPSMDGEPEAAIEPDAAPEPVAAAAPAAPLTTREIIERARTAARGARERPASPGRGDSVLQGLAFGRARKRPGGMTSALMVASLLAAVSLTAAGFVVLEAQPGGPLPKRVADALALVRGAPAASALRSASAAPLAAMALAPRPDFADPALATEADMAARHLAAVAKFANGEVGGLAEIRALAAQGYAPSEFFLSTLYEEGKAGLKKDPVQARGWAQRAAEGGDRAAMHNLALDEFEGVGGPRNAAAAAEWFRRAAELGLLDSQFNLAGLYEHGQGVSQNSAEAYKWYLIAANAGDPEARASALRVRADLTPEARTVAERAAAAFAPAPPSASAQAAPAAPSPDLVTAQRALNQLGYYQGPTDGAASPALHLAIAAYQRDQGLTVTGSPDALTIGKLAAYTR